MVCSAVETVLPPGVFITTIPWRVAAGTSMLSTPTPGADDRLEPGLALQDLGRQLRARADHDPVGLVPAPAARRRVLGELRVDDDLDARLGPEQRQAFLGQLVGHQHAMRHGRRLSDTVARC